MQFSYIHWGQTVSLFLQKWMTWNRSPQSSVPRLSLVLQELRVQIHPKTDASFIDLCTKIPKLVLPRFCSEDDLSNMDQTPLHLESCSSSELSKVPWQSSWDKENAVTPRAQPAQPWLPALAARLREHHAGVSCLKRSQGKARDCANRAGQQQERSPTDSRT